MKLKNKLIAYDYNNYKVHADTSMKWTKRTEGKKQEQKKKMKTKKA